jgi:sulfatase maturation enzyme AslB (radical SAM superfamily)
MKKEKSNIPINKGNYSMETPEREKLFHNYLSIGWEEEYGKYRNCWREYPRQQYVAEYPLLIDLELSTICNLKCPMCYTTTEYFKGKVTAEFMDFSLFKKIIEEITGKVPAVRLSLRGEPTLHPDFIECVRYAKTRGICEVSCLTNGSKLTRDFFQKIMEAGIDWITISVDGLSQNYEMIRRPLKFKDTFQKIKDIKEIKIKNKRLKPVIKIQSVWPAIRENPEEFYNIFAPYVDLIAFNPLIDYLGKDKNEEIVYEKNFICPQHYQRLVVGSDGLVLMCSNDEDGLEVIGDANNESIYTIWHGERLNRVRLIHKQENGFLQIPICRKCYLPRLTEDKEVSEVNSRKFIIKNYVNRRQCIGE